jgi:hypothetical protein
MHKGVSPLQNVQLLKWCLQYGVTPMWNLLYGFPGENAQDYRINLEFIRALTHLAPPMGYGAVRLERFSPIFEHPAQFGIRHVRPVKPYRYLYPFEESAVHNIAYFFDFDFDGKEKIERWFAPLNRELERWKLLPTRPVLQSTQIDNDEMIVEDTRPTRILAGYRFAGREKAIIEFCDRARRFPKIVEYLRSLDGDTAAAGEPADEVWLQGFLDYLVAHRLMVRTRDRYLSVILEPEQAG